VNRNTFDESDPAVQEAMQQSRHQLDLQFHPAQGQAFEDITALVDAIRGAETLEDYREIQQRLGDHVRQIEQGVGEANKRAAQADRKLRRLAKRINPPDQTEIDLVEAERRQADFDRQLYLRLAHQYRCVGDAMAWQLYDFQTRYISALGMNASPGLIGQKEGAAAEEQEVERFWRDEDAFALRHDLTNCLRVWDMSVFYPDAPERTQIVEIKGGEHSRVRPKQRVQGLRVQEFVQQRMTTTQEGVLLIHRAHEPSATDDLARTNFPLLLQAMQDADRDSMGFAANQYLAISAVDLSDQRVRFADETMQQQLLAVRQIPSQIMTTPCPDFLVAYSHQKVETPNFGAPYTIYPVPPYIAAALVTGFMRLVLRLNVCVLLEAFGKAGLQGRFIPPQPPKPGKVGTHGDYFELHRGTVTIKIGVSVIEQMLFEGLTLDDLASSVSRECRILELRRPVIVPAIVGNYRRQAHVLTTFVGLEQVWRASRQLRSPEEEDGTDKPDQGGQHQAQRQGVERAKTPASDGDIGETSNDRSDGEHPGSGG
jgi:hypothetical protein